MAAKKAGGATQPQIIKSQLIRETLEALGLDTASGEIIRRLKQRNIDVSPAQVSNVKAMLRRKAGMSRARPPRGRRFTADDLLEVKKLADRLGGVKTAIEALELLQRLR
jgi:hypothetical protein